MENKHLNCIICEKDENQTPLFVLSYKGQEIKICPQHVPVLIHDPQKLIGFVEGAENFTAG